jgi:uncharacterized membrane protein (DUF4010 family)
MNFHLLDQIPKEFVQFILTVLFSLLIGMEQHRHHRHEEVRVTFGTDRTFTLIGVLGYILFIITPNNPIAFLTGLVILALFLGIFYSKKIDEHKRFGFTSVVTAIITYCLGPLIITQPQWFVLSLVVFILIITEIKDDLTRFSRKFDNAEFVTLAKFLALAGVILPLLPNTPISAEFSITPYHFWLSIVVVSAISYLSYLLQKFVFPHSGILLAGILGGLYSSTATTIILARKSKQDTNNPKIVSAILLAIAMMYLRIYILAALFSPSIATALQSTFIILFITCVLLAFIFTRFHHKINATQQSLALDIPTEQRNPLEFKTAFVFGILFVIFAVATHFVLSKYGRQGLNTMAMIVGVTDIDPFIMNLLQGKWTMSHGVLAGAILHAINSNNIAKLVYSLVLGDKSLRKSLLISFGILIATGIVIVAINGL